MEVEVQAPSSSEPEPHLLVDWKADNTRPPLSVTAIGSILIHVVVLVGVWLAPALPNPQPRFENEVVDIRKAVPLVLPPELLTQKAANKHAVSKELDLAGLIAKPDVKSTAPTAPVTAPVRKFEPPAAKKQEAKSIDPNKVEPAPVLQAQNPPAIGTAEQPLPINLPPPPPPAEKPKLAFETPGAQTGSKTGHGGLLQGPNMTVEEAGKRVMQGAGSTSVSESDLQLPFSAPGRSPQSKGSSALELLSDPMGVDFRPYLVRVLAAVRHNWFLVLPEGARMGQRGRTVVQFTIAKNGSVPKLVIHMPSGNEPLDRAAVAGISASNPFPPLPNEYHGEVLRLQLVFSYNMPGAR
ncbi:MAG TPA: energy transducer TonB [Bryobacteraceae bacterium]|jgi:TonB family protein